MLKIFRNKLYAKKAVMFHYKYITGVLFAKINRSAAGRGVTELECHH